MAENFRNADGSPMSARDLLRRVRDGDLPKSSLGFMEAAIDKMFADYRAAFATFFNPPMPSFDPPMPSFDLPMPSFDLATSPLVQPESPSALFDLAATIDKAISDPPAPPSTSVSAVRGINDVLAFADAHGLGDADVAGIQMWFTSMIPMPADPKLAGRADTLAEAAACAEIAERAERLARDYGELARHARNGERARRAAYRRLADQGKGDASE